MTLLIPEKEKETGAFEHDSKKTSKLRKSLARRFKILALKSLILKVVPLLLIIGGVVYFVRENPQILGLSKDVPEEGEFNQEEIKSLVEEVGEIIELPQDETPTIATVSDLSKVRDREFFKKAKNGDTVLIYKVAKKAYLYRASEKKIIEVGVVTIEEEGQSTGSSLESIDSGNTSSPTPTQSAILTPTVVPEETIIPITSPTPAPTVF